jgi:hypothetical protein
MRGYVSAQVGMSNDSAARPRRVYRLLSGAVVVALHFTSFQLCPAGAWAQQTSTKAASRLGFSACPRQSAHPYLHQARTARLNVVTAESARVWALILFHSRPDTKFALRL